MFCPFTRLTPLVLLVCCVAPSMAAEPIGRTPGQTWERLKETLAMRVSLDVEQAPLGRALAHLSQQTGVKMVIDETALDDLGIGVDEPVTVSLQDVTLGTLFETMLSQLELTWFYRRGVMVITTEEEEESALVTRVYPVGDLISNERLAPYHSSGYDPLIDVIVSTVSSETWAENGGGEAEIREFHAARALIVSQTFRTHLLIEELLDDIRRVGRAQGLALWAPNESSAGEQLAAPRLRTYVNASGVWQTPRVHGGSAGMEGQE